MYRPKRVKILKKIQFKMCNFLIIVLHPMQVLDARMLMEHFYVLNSTDLSSHCYADFNYLRSRFTFGHVYLQKSAYHQTADCFSHSKIKLVPSGN